jgi:lysophospholipase L1-like esterase
MKNAALLVALIIALAAPAVSSARVPERWEKEVAAYATEDAQHPPVPGAVFFAGSSSIRLWRTLAADFPGVPVYGRGVGGSLLAELPELAEVLVCPYQPRVVVVYAGDNDIASNSTADEVVASFVRFRDQLRRAVPLARLVFIAIKPSTRREAFIPKTREANKSIAALCEADPQCTFVDVFTPMLTAEGKPRGELLAADGLHLSPAGYRLWTQLVGPVLPAFPGK